MPLPSLFAAAAVAAAAHSAPVEPTTHPPAAIARPVTHIYFGTQVTDRFRYMESRDARGAPTEQIEPHKAVGYLRSSQRPDGVALLGPPPPAGSGAKLGDLATYWSTRRLQSSP